MKGEPEPVPLADMGWYNLTIFSRSPVFPVLSLGYKDFDLGWDGNAVSSRTSHGLPLPAFTKHHIAVKCEASEQVVECSLMVRETTVRVHLLYGNHFDAVKHVIISGTVTSVITFLP